jgi:hypothetical protein
LSYGTDADQDGQWRERLKNGRALPIFESVLGGDDGRDFIGIGPRRRYNAVERHHAAPAAGPRSKTQSFSLVLSRVAAENLRSAAAASGCISPRIANDETLVSIFISSAVDRAAVASLNFAKRRSIND